jgi:hypothetical protein
MRKKRQPTVWYLLIRGSYIILLRLVVPRKTRGDRLEDDLRTAEYYARLRRKYPLPESVRRYVEDGILPSEIDSSLLAMAIICITKEFSNSQLRKLRAEAAQILAELSEEEQARCYQALVAHYRWLQKGVTIRRRLNAALNVKNTS